jgi:hypothetical protein
MAKPCKIIASPKLAKILNLEPNQELSYNNWARILHDGGFDTLINDEIVSIKGIAPQPKGVKTSPTALNRFKAGLSKFKGAATTAQNAAERVASALKEAGIRVEVIDNEDDYNREAQKRGGGKGTEGMFVSTEGVIYLNKNKIEGNWGTTIVWHEATHPIINIIRNTNPELFNKIVSGAKRLTADKGLQSALKFAEAYREGMTITENSDGKFELYDGNNLVETFDSEQAANDYIDAVVADEFIVEAIARIVDGKIDIEKFPTSLRQSIIDFINNVLGMLGVKGRVSDTDIAQFKKLAAQVSDVLQSGRGISEIVGKENVEKYESNFIIGTNNGQFRVSSSKKTDKKLNKKEKVSRPFDEKLIEFTDVDIYDGKKAVGFLGDKQIVGNVESPTGVTLEGKGGGLYPIWANKDALRQLKNKAISAIKKGKIWATTDLKGAKKLLNALKNGSLAAIGTQASEGILGNKMMLEHYSNLLEKSLSDYDKIIKENESKEKVEDAENSKKELIAAINNPLNTNFKPNLTYRDKIIDSLERIKQSKDSTPIQKKNAEKSLGVLKKGNFGSIQELYDAMYDLSYEVRTGFFTKVFNITNRNKFNLTSITK